jgi:RNA polymerase sigma-70 factor (ECF subfamily)
MRADLNHDTDDLTLLSAIAEQDQAAFQLFYRRYGSVVYALSRRITGQDQDAEDVVAEVFWELWEKSSRYCPSKSSPYSYLVMLTRCRALDRKRGVTARRTHHILEWAADGKPPLEPEFPAPETSCVAAESRDLVTRALQDLDPNQQQAIKLIYFDGLTHRATAQKLGVPLGTLKGRIRSALVHLRGSLQIFQR